MESARSLVDEIRILLFRRDLVRDDLISVANELEKVALTRERREIRSLRALWWATVEFEDDRISTFDVDKTDTQLTTKRTLKLATPGYPTAIPRLLNKKLQQKSLS